MKDYIKLASDRVGINEGEQGVRHILANILLNPGISTKELARKVMIPVPLVTAVVKELTKEGVLDRTNGISVSSAGKSYSAAQLGLENLNLELYRRIMDGSWSLEKDFAREAGILQSIFNARPQVDVLIDQSKCTVHTSIKRALLCLRTNALLGRNILCVGDDDLVSISLGFLLKKLLPGKNTAAAELSKNMTNIYVIDKDRRFLDYISQVAQHENLPVHCHGTDLRKPLPPELLERFDCFFTDPPYTLQGMTLFLSRGISALKKRPGLPVFLSFAHKSPEVTYLMQQQLLQMGMVITEILPRFNEYEGAELIGNQGQMIVLQTTSHTSPIITDFFDQPIYTGELKKTRRTYKCRNCGELTTVGIQENMKTIENLKEKGCSKCGGNTFDLIEKKQLEGK